MRGLRSHQGALAGVNLACVCLNVARPSEAGVSEWNNCAVMVINVMQHCTVILFWLLDKILVVYLQRQQQNHQRLLASQGQNHLASQGCARLTFFSG